MIGANVLEGLGFKKGHSSSQASKSAKVSSDQQLISDFTLVDFRYLLILINKCHVVVFDCHQVLSGSARQVRNINQFQLGVTQDSPDNQQEDLQRSVFNRIESFTSSQQGGRGANQRLQQKSSHGDGLEPRRVLVLGKHANQMLLLEFSEMSSSEDDMMESP